MGRAALLVLASLAAAGEADLCLPDASAATKPFAGAAVVSLSEDGLIGIEKEGKPESPSLDQLCVWLRDRAAKFDEARKAKGGGFTTLPSGLAASEMPVLLRVDERAPWGHAQRLLLACAEERIYRVGFGVKGAAGEEGWLPFDLPVERETPADPKPGARSRSPVKIVVSIGSRREESAVWGPTQAPITRPAEIFFRMGETEVVEVDKVRRYIRDAYQTASASNPASITGEIEAGAKIPVGVVVSVLNEYLRAGLPGVRFRGTPAPTAEERRTTRLPYPSR